MDKQKMNSISEESFFCPIGTEMMLRVENNEAHLKSSLIGIDQNHYLILKTPKTPEVESLLKIDKSVKAIFLHNGTIYGFISKILSVIGTPVPLFFLSYPEIMEKHELRKNLRIDCSIPVCLHKDENIDYTGIITDLSSGGCGVTISKTIRQLPTYIKVDSVLGLSCEMLEIQRDRTIRCIVKNKILDDKKLHMGLQFDNADADILKQIQSYVNRVLGVIS